MLNLMPVLFNLDLFSLQTLWPLKRSSNTGGMTFIKVPFLMHVDSLEKLFFFRNNWLFCLFSFFLSFLNYFISTALVLHLASLM